MDILETSSDFVLDHIGRAKERKGLRVKRVGISGELDAAAGGSDGLVGVPHRGRGVVTAVHVHKDALDLCLPLLVARPAEELCGLVVVAQGPLILVEVPEDVAEVCVAPTSPHLCPGRPRRRPLLAVQDDGTGKLEDAADTLFRRGVVAASLEEGVDSKPAPLRGRDRNRERGQVEARRNDGQVPETRQSEAPAK